MAKVIVSGYALAPGSGIVDKSRMETGEFRTPSGLDCSVAMVAETIDSALETSLPAEIAVKTALEYLKNAATTDPSQMIAEAFRAANAAVHEEGRVKGVRLACSLAIALIVDDSKLYVGNLGNTRIYLYSPDEGLARLTMEHTFANIMTQSGQMSYSKALAHNKAYSIMRSVGVNEDADADIGFYNGVSDYEVARFRGSVGYSLRAGEAVIVCADGFYKTSDVTGEPFVTEAELTRTLQTRTGADAARELIEYAIPRKPQDSITVGLLQMPLQRVASVNAAPSNRGMLVYGALLLLLIGFGAVFLLPRFSQTMADSPSAAMTSTAEHALLNAEGTRIALIPSDTPIPTITPTFRAGEIGAVRENTNRANANRSVIRDGETVQSEALYLVANINTVGASIEDARLFIQPESHLEIGDVTSDSMLITLYEGANLFLDTGDYADGATVHMADEVNMVFSVSGSCMSVAYDENGNISAACYDGNCEYGYGDPNDPPHPIPVGEEITIFPETARTQRRTSIRPTTLREYYLVLQMSDQGRRTLDTCFGDYVMFVPTDTPTPTNTPEATATPTETPTPEGTATNTPTRTRTPTPFGFRPSRTPIQTATPIPTNTHTNVPAPTQRPGEPTFTPTRTPTRTPIPTNTPIPPTATNSATRTNTPIPPTETNTPTRTNTPIPPTATNTATNTLIAATNTPTRTNTPVLPTSTNTPTNTSVPPTATNTSVPPTPTNTPIPPTNTPEPPTNTPIPPTNTPEPPPTDTPVPPPTNTPVPEPPTNTPDG